MIVTCSHFICIVFLSDEKMIALVRSSMFGIYCISAVVECLCWDLMLHLVGNLRIILVMDSPRHLG